MKLPCPSPECTSSDGFVIQPDGEWGHCFVCGINKKIKDSEKLMEKEKVPAEKESITSSKSFSPICTKDDARAFRGLSPDTIYKYGVVVAANPKESGFLAKYPRYTSDCKTHVRNKIRVEDKGFFWEGDKQPLSMFGQQLFPPASAKAITITEGQDDAMAAYEMQGSKYPCVSVDSAASAEREVRDNFEYLNSFEKVVICFDDDKPGREAAEKVAKVLPPGKAFIFRSSSPDLKDANDYLLQGKAATFQKDWWDAPLHKVDGLKMGTEMFTEIVERPNHFTVPYPIASMNEKTFGIRLSEAVIITAPTGVGKTSIIKEIEYSLLMNPDLIEKNYGVGFLHLEETNADTCLGLMSIHSDKPYHLPDCPRTEEELKASYDACINNNRVVLWDHFGSNTVDAVLDKVRHMAALGCKYIVLDHLSIIVSDQAGDERKQLDEISTKLKTLCMNLNIALIAVVHTNRQGQIRGTAGIEQLANIVFKLERDITAVDDWRRNVLKIVVEKNRFSGRTGPGIYLFYNENTSRLEELTQEEILRYEEGEAPNDAERGW